MVRLHSEVFETADTAQIQAIRLFPATFGSDRQGLEAVQRSQVQILSPLLQDEGPDREVRAFVVLG